MPSATIQPLDGRQPVIVSPAEIRPGDWLEDQGTLRQVDYVDILGVGNGAAVVRIVHFKHQLGVSNLVRGITEGTALAVWRTLPELHRVGRV